jgi:glycosyltransferase involved in cell wall biosynthesis
MIRRILTVMSCYAHSSVGVVIPLHNKRRYIRRSVESALRQTHGDFRLIVVDDGSTDGGGECVEQISDSRVSVVRTPCRGPGAARNVGIRALQSEWIALLDADDEWEPAFLEKTVAAARRVPDVVAVFTGIRVRNAAETRLASAEGLIDDYHGARMRFKVAMTSSSLLLHRSTFLSAGGFREGYRYAEDTEAWFRLACEGPSFYIREALSVIEVNDPGSTTRCADAAERAAGLQQLLDSYEYYHREERIPRRQARSCRKFMQHQRGRLALHLISAGRHAEGARLLLTGVPLGSQTWREYVACAALLLGRRRS